ncbi:MAG: DNA adenine methylase [Salinimicrobium sp.]
MYYSPMRYPGGKNKLAPFIAKICTENDTSHYVEPYSGGASVAFFLLLEGYVERITINDRDRSVYALWHAILNKTNKLIKRIEETEVTVENWHKQRLIQANKKRADLLDLGFSTLFMNRTNRSGIITGGIIGGVEQTGEYKISCRFNKEEIISRIRNIKKKRKYITLYKKDALKLIQRIQEREREPARTLFYFDPPYYQKAESLYMNYYLAKDHQEVGQAIKNIQEIPWVVSYDNNPAIREIYRDFPVKEFSFKHSAYEVREGKEILFFSENLNYPDLENRNPVGFKRKQRGKGIVYKETVSRAS